MGKKTPLFEEHQKLKATMTDFVGWKMPVYYSTPIKEHLAVRETVGLFDVSHMGVIFIEGKQAIELLQLLLTRDCSRLKDGKMLLSVMCNERGGILDDLTVYRLNEKKFMVVVNAGTIEKDFEWIQEHAREFDCDVRNASNGTAKLDLQGPGAEEILQPLVPIDLKEIPYYGFSEMEVVGEKAIVSRSGYTGEDGFEIYLDSGKAIGLWNALLGEGSGIVPCGLAARDTLRLECCMPLYGHEISEQRSPLEGTYNWVVNFDKGEFIGKGALEEQRKKGVKEKLVAFEMIERAIARHGHKLFAEGKEAGVVTSGSYSPSLKKNIGLGYIGGGFSQPGEELEVEVRGKMFKARVVDKPFYRRAKHGKSR